MFKVFLLVGAFLFFRALLPRASRNSPTAITPYMNGLDGAMSAQETSSVLDDMMPYESWRACHYTRAGEAGRVVEPISTSINDEELASCGAARVRSESALR